MIKILEYIVEHGVNLETWNLSGYAFKKKEALNLLELFYLNNIFVLGGDLMKIENNYVDYIYMNWSSNPSLKSSKESIEYAKKYINSYMNNEYVNFTTKICFDYLIDINNITKKENLFTLLSDLVNINRDIQKLLMDVYNSDWNKKSNNNIVLSIKHIQNILNLYLSNKIENKELKEWIDLIELREDIVYDNHDKEFILDAIIKLKNINLMLGKELLFEINNKLEGYQY